MTLAVFQRAGKCLSLNIPFAFSVTTTTAFSGRFFNALLLMLSGPGAFRFLRPRMGCRTSWGGGWRDGSFRLLICNLLNLLFDFLDVVQVGVWEVGPALQFQTEQTLRFLLVGVDHTACSVDGRERLSVVPQ
jgi:hypothetical protein